MATNSMNHVRINAFHLRTEELQYEWNIRRLAGVPSPQDLNRQFTLEEDRGDNLLDIGRPVNIPIDYGVRAFALYSAVSNLSQEIVERVYLRNTVGSMSTEETLGSRIRHYELRLGRIHERFQTRNEFRTARRRLTTSAMLWRDSIVDSPQLVLSSTTMDIDRTFTTGNLPSRRGSEAVNQPVNSTANIHVDAAPAVVTNPFLDTPSSVPRQTTFTPRRPNTVPPDQNAHWENRQSGTDSRPREYERNERPSMDRNQGSREQGVIQPARQLPYNRSINTIPLMPHEMACPDDDEPHTEPMRRETRRQSRSGSPRNQSYQTPPPNHRESTRDGSHRSRGNEEGFNHSQAFSQENMAMRRYIGPKTFDGESIGAKTFSLEEIIDTIRMFQQSGATDDIVLRNIGMSLSGEARTWWSANRGRIESVRQWEQAIRNRFDQRQSSKEALLTTVYSRKQKEDERLARYFDEMNVMMDRLPNEFSELHRIAILIENANDQCKPLLRLKGARTLHELVEYANTFVDFKAIPKMSASKPSRFIKKVNTTTVNTEHESPETSDAEEQDGNEIDVQAIIRQLTKKFEKTIKGERKQDNSKKNVKAIQFSANNQEQGNTKSQTIPIKGDEPVICPNCLCWGHRFENCQDKPQRRLCYGCGRPDTFKNECPRCSPISKNEKSCLNATAHQAPAQQN